MGTFKSKTLIILVTCLLFCSESFAQCINKWSQISRLKTVRTLNVKKIAQNGQVHFRIQENNKKFSLARRSNKIYAYTSQGNAQVRICERGGVMVVVADLGIFGQKKVVVTDRGGYFNINMNGKNYTGTVR